MAWVRCCGASKQKYNRLIFPPKDNWTATGTASGINVGDVALTVGAMNNGQVADFTVGDVNYDSNKTLSVTASTVNVRRLYILVDGAQAATQLVPQNGSVTVTYTLPAGLHTVIIRVANTSSWASAGNTNITAVSCV